MKVTQGHKEDLELEDAFFSNWQEEQELEKKKEMKGMHEWRAREDHAYKITNDVCKIFLHVAIN